MSRARAVIASYAALRRNAVGAPDEAALLARYDEQEARDLAASRSSTVLLLRSLADHWLTFAVTAAAGIGLSHLAS